MHGRKKEVWPQRGRRQCDQSRRLKWYTEERPSAEEYGRGHWMLEKARKHSLLEPPKGTSYANNLIFNPVKVISDFWPPEPLDNKSMLSHPVCVNLLYRKLLYSNRTLLLSHCMVILVFPSGSNGKESACSEGDPSSIPGLGRPLGEGNGYSVFLPVEFHGERCVSHLIYPFTSWYILIGGFSELSCWAYSYTGPCVSYGFISLGQIYLRTELLWHRAGVCLAL